MLTAEQRGYWYSLGYELDLNTFEDALENVKEKSDAIWFFLKGLLQTYKDIDSQCRELDWLSDYLEQGLAPYFNRCDVLGAEYGERLLQHALIYNKDKLVLNILEEPGIEIAVETSELRSTPLLIALMNDLSQPVIDKLICDYAIFRKNSRDLSAFDYAQKTNNTQFLERVKHKRPQNPLVSRSGYAFLDAPTNDAEELVQDIKKKLD